MSNPDQVEGRERPKIRVRIGENGIQAGYEGSSVDVSNFNGGIIRFNSGLRREIPVADLKLATPQVLTSEVK